MRYNGESPIYTYETNDVWKSVDSYDGVAVYAYGDSEMYVLTPGEATIPLFEMMTMKSISNAEYATVEDISADPIEVWNICKELGNIE